MHGLNEEPCRLENDGAAAQGADRFYRAGQSLVAKLLPKTYRSRRLI